MDSEYGEDEEDDLISAWDKTDEAGMTP